MGRWQLSTPILATIISSLSFLGYWQSAILANLIGASIFFWLDRRLFASVFESVWEVKDNISCIDCGKIARGYRLIKTKNYDRTLATPEFRCEECSIIKANNLKKNGVKM